MSITFETNIKFYTDIDLALVDYADDQVSLPERGDLWYMMVAASAMLRASDAIGWSLSLQ